MKMLLIVNPRSGKNQIKPYLCDIIDMYVAQGYEVTVYTTQCQNDGFEKARSSGADYDIVVCCGGDGTLDEVSAGLVHTSCPPILGYIPAGSTNDFARSLGISSVPMEAAETVITGVPFACDIGKFNGKNFVYVAAFGVFSAVSYETPQEEKNVLGHLAYVLEGIRSLNSIKTYHVVAEYGDRRIEGDYIYGMVTNSISVGGFKSISGALMELNDGLFEVLLIKEPKSFLEFQGLLTCLVTQDINEKYMTLIKTDHIKFTCDDDIAWTLDGEDGGDHKVAEIINCKQQLRIIRPAEIVYDEAEKVKSAKVQKIEEMIDVVITEDV